MVGPGIGQALYGGCSFIFPPRSIPDIWTDDRLRFTQTLEERLLGERAAALTGTARGSCCPIASLGSLAAHGAENGAADRLHPLGEVLLCDGGSAAQISRSQQQGGALMHSALYSLIPLTLSLQVY